jgi:hypothetical protein
MDFKVNKAISLVGVRHGRRGSSYKVDLNMNRDRQNVAKVYSTFAIEKLITKTNYR